MDACLFDLDGTLIDSRDDIAASANYARQALGLPLRPPEEIFPFIGEGARALIERTLGPEHGGRIDEALAAWASHYGQHMLDRTRVYPGVLEALGSLPGAKAIVTNKPGPSARRLCDALGLSNLFPVVLGGGDAAARKPDPAIVQEALARLGGSCQTPSFRFGQATPAAAPLGAVAPIVKPPVFDTSHPGPIERAVLVGDSGVDAATAVAAGTGFVGVLWGMRPREEMEASGARIFVARPDELPEACRRALAQGAALLKKKPRTHS